MDNLSHQQPQFLIAGPGGDNEESGFDFWGVLSRRKWLVFLGLVTGMALGGLYNAQCETIYKSEASIQIEPRTPAVFSPNTNGGPLLPDPTQKAIRHDQLIGQVNIVSACLENNDLMNLPSFSTLAEDEIVPEVIDNLEIAQNREEPLLYELAFHSSSPEDCRTILNSLVATYEAKLKEYYEEDKSEVVILLEQLKKTLLKDIRELTEKLNVELAKDASVKIRGSDLHSVKVAELAKQIDDVKQELSSINSNVKTAFDVMNKSEEDMQAVIWNFKRIGVIADDGQRPDSKVRLIESWDQSIQQARVEEAQALQEYGPGHRIVKSIRTRITQFTKLRDELAADDSFSGIPPRQILEWFTNNESRKIKLLQDTLDALNQDYLINYKEASRIADIQRRIETLTEQLDENKEVLKTLKLQLMEITSVEAGARGNDQGYRVHHLKDATYGEVVWPILPIILGIGGLLGSLAGFGLGCLVELADKTFHNPDQIMKELNIPLIGHVPVIGKSKRYLVENSLIDPTICTYHRPKSQVSEAFRAVRTALYFNTQGKQHSVIQVTSPTPGDGKSTLASNLAVSIAQSGKRVLLVDADMRRPRQHAAFGITSNEGFATVLSGQSQWRDVMFECEEIEGLLVMPCGAKPNNPAELCSSPQIKVLIEEMREEFDFVIIDTPPMLAVTDPSPIAARVDGVVLCLRIKKNVSVSARRATEMIANLGANCIGLVVNGVGAQSGYGSQYTYGAYQAGYSYNGYGYGYGYGYGATGKYYDEDQKGRQANFNRTRHIESQPSDSQEVEESRY